jgi:ADP-ribose pyrophosphatase YjhB (NUDIX family)
VSTLAAARLIELADAIAAEAQNGTHWTKDRYDRERFARILQYASEILAGALDFEPEAVARWYTDEPGTVTSKIGVSAAAFDATGRMLLIQRRDNGLWAQPGGAVEYGESLAETARREVWEESGVAAEPTALLGIYEARRHGFQTIYHWQHLVFLAAVTGGTPGPSDETLAAGFFTEDAANALPISPGHAEPIRDAFAAYGNACLAPFFDRE